MQTALGSQERTSAGSWPLAGERGLQHHSLHLVSPLKLEKTGKRILPWSLRPPGYPRNPGRQPANTLTIIQWAWWRTSDLQNYKMINVCCFALLNLGWFVMVRTENITACPCHQWFCPMFPLLPPPGIPLGERDRLTQQDTGSSDPLLSVSLMAQGKRLCGCLPPPQDPSSLSEVLEVVLQHT